MYIILAFFDIFFSQIVARFLLNWWAPIFANEQGWLPPWLIWLQTFDNSLDEGWQGGTYDIPVPTNKWQRHWARVKWLWRNSAYGFSYWPMGKEFNPTEWTIVRWDEQVHHLTGPAGQFSYIYEGKWGQLKLGWKAWNYWDNDHWRTTSWGPEWRVPIVFGYTPFKRK